MGAELTATPTERKEGAATIAAVYLSLLKLRIVALLVFLSLVTATAATAGNPPLGRVALLVVLGTLASAGASVANNLLDRDIDSAMKRTRGRALPTGSLSPGKALLLSFVSLVAALLLAVLLGPATAVFVFLGAFTYIVVYTGILKRRTPVNIVVGGMAGSFAVLAGWSAVSSSLTSSAIVLALILFLWTPSHFWAFAIVNEDDYRGAGIPMLPVCIGASGTAKWILVHTVSLSLVAVSLAAAGSVGAVYLVSAMVLGVLFSTSALTLAMNPEKKVAWRHYKASGLYLLLLFLALGLDVLLARGATS